MEGITIAAKFVHAYLAFHQGENSSCHPGVNRIASDLRLHRSTVLRALSELEASGLISVVRHADGPRMANEYAVVAKCDQSQNATSRKMRPESSEQDALLKEGYNYLEEQHTPLKEQYTPLEEYNSLEKSIPLEEPLNTTTAPATSDSITGPEQEKHFGIIHQSPIDAAPFAPIALDAADPMEDMDPDTKSLHEALHAMFGGAHRVRTSRYTEAEIIGDETVGRKRFAEIILACKADGETWAVAKAQARTEAGAIGFRRGRAASGRSEGGQDHAMRILAEAEAKRASQGGKSDCDW